jgi:16S rRNA (cytidine1402-2'-O)-methyltransferase
MIADEPRVSVFFESSHRIIKSLNSLHKYLGNKRRVVVCREMTKLYEEVIRGFAKDILSHYLLNPTKVKGEFVVIVDLVEKSAH